MPFKSKAQARFMYAKHPKLAKEFAAHTESIKSLPEHAPTHAYKTNPSASKRGGCLICGKPYEEH